eukprot:scaffold2668_cov115-Isochrysis_galbana.AAC.25
MAWRRRHGRSHAVDLGSRLPTAANAAGQGSGRHRLGADVRALWRYSAVGSARIIGCGYAVLHAYYLYAIAAPKPRSATLRRCTHVVRSAMCHARAILVTCFLVARCSAAQHSSRV